VQQIETLGADFKLTFYPPHLIQLPEEDGPVFERPGNQDPKKDEDDDEDAYHDYTPQNDPDTYGGGAVPDFSKER